MKYGSVGKIMRQEYSGGFEVVSFSPNLTTSEMDKSNIASNQTLWKKNGQKDHVGKLIWGKV